MVQFNSRIKFEFGKFEYPCAQGSLTLCPALDPIGMSSPLCYSRNIDIGGFLLFQPGISYNIFCLCLFIVFLATLIIILIALVMTFIMIYNIRRKYTAVGRKEMVLFFYAYAVNLVFDFLLLSNIVPIGASLYPVTRTA
jgi:Chitin synthase export chaperone